MSWQPLHAISCSEAFVFRRKKYHQHKSFKNLDISDHAIVADISPLGHMEKQVQIAEVSVMYKWE